MRTQSKTCQSVLKKDEDGNCICLKDDSFVCPDGEEYGTCCGCPLGEAIDNRFPEDDC